MRFTEIYRTLVAGLLATSINASPYYGINVGSSKLQARDLFVDQTTNCDDFVYGAQNTKVGKVCVGITQGILTVAYGSLTGCTYNTVHVYVGTVPPTDRNPGGFPYSSDPGGVCSIGAGGATASCSIPVQNSWRECEKTLYIATHASITCGTTGQTGWGAGTCFGGTGGNCAKYWMFTTHCYCPTVSVFPQEYRTSTSIYTSTSTTAFLTSTTSTYTTSATSTYTSSTTVTFETSTTSVYTTTEFPETVITSVTTSTLPLSSTTSTVTCTNPSA